MNNDAQLQADMDACIKTSLDKLRAKWQADALDSMADMVERVDLHATPLALRRRAKHIRQQADQ